jgi:hypothetical protein
MCEVILQMLCFIFQSISARFQPFTDIETEAVFSLDEDALITTDEVKLEVIGS